MIRLLIGDCRERLRELPDGSVHTCVTSPPYFGLRDYGHEGQIGLEPTPDEFVAAMVEVFREVRRVLRDDGTLWLNLGDSYNADGRKGRAHMGEGKNSAYSAWVNKTCAGTKPKDLLGIPWMVAFALRADGWWLRQDIIWAKPNPMPESVKDRCTKAHEYLFLLSKSSRYHFDAEAIAEPLAPASVSRLAQDVASQAGSERVPGKTNGTMKAVRSQRLAERAVERSGVLTGGTANSTLGHAAEGSRNKRSVWSVATQPFKEAHFATYPPELVEPCILAGCPKGGTVLDPFGGAGTTGLVADRLQRDAVLIELNPEYAAIARRRLEAEAGMFSNLEVAA